MKGAGLPFLSALVLAFTLPVWAAPRLAVVVLEGDGALNSVDARRAKDPVVRVERGGRPVPGAVVTFMLPVHGPGATFGDEEASYTATAGQDGTVTGRGLRPNRIAGSFHIRVTASSGGETATAIVRQTNVASVERGGAGRKYIWLGVIGGAALGGALMAFSGGSSAPVEPSGPAPSAPGGGAIVIVAPGPPRLGPPR